MARELKFLNPVFRPGLNLTVRNGDKWADLVPGFDLALVATDNSVQPTLGTVIAAHVLYLDPQVDHNYQRIQVIDDAALEFEHDPDCRTWKGLVAAMDRAYPAGWGPALTLVWFNVGVKAEDDLTEAPAVPSAADAEIGKLANVILAEYGGPVENESACEAAIRLLGAFAAVTDDVEAGIHVVSGDRVAVYQAIDSERDYQDDRFADLDDRGQPVPVWLGYIQKYLGEAVARVGNPEDSVVSIRKIAALCVAAMEEHGAPRRKGF